jgi:hypothetical protein
MPLAARGVVAVTAFLPATGLLVYALIADGRWLFGVAAIGVGWVTSIGLERLRVLPRRRVNALWPFR